MSLPQRLPLPLMQTQWASQLDPVLGNPLVQGNLLTGIALINGVTVINHKLSRQMQGWIIVDQNAAATVYRSAALNSSTLSLTSNAAVTVALWVF
jgi:hypothetical protein